MECQAKWDCVWQPETIDSLLFKALGSERVLRQDKASKTVPVAISCFPFLGYWQMQAAINCTFKWGEWH